MTLLPILQNFKFNNLPLILLPLPFCHINSRFKKSCPNRQDYYRANDLRRIYSIASRPKKSEKISKFIHGKILADNFLYCNFQTTLYNYYIFEPIKQAGSE